MAYYSNSGGGGFNPRLIIGVVIALIGIVGYFSHSTYNEYTNSKVHVSMSPEQEVQLGLQAAPQMAAEMGGDAPDSDPRARLVQQVGAEVSRAIVQKGTKYKFVYHLVQDPKTINAFALPGGQIFITRALLDRLSTRAQLAGVLGHETGHVVAQHVAQQIEKQKLGAAVATGVGVAGSDRGYAPAAIAQMVNNMFQLHFSRADESQADKLGVRLMAQAGYDPRAMIEVMQILKKSGGPGGPAIFQTHPNPDQRIADLKDLIEETYPNGVPSNLTEGDRIGPTSMYIDTWRERPAPLRQAA